MTEHEGTYCSLHEIVLSAEHSAERRTAEPVWTSRHRNNSSLPLASLPSVACDIMRTFPSLSATYTFIGGLGATFYVSYFNTTIMFTIILTFLAKVYNEPNNSNNPLGEYKVLRLSLQTGD